ncbi:hypothetical protein [Methylocystis parvus]|uniref:hypothetical protein n=1 Tax=Methylocystis parvus TaxID=134 RepID=UPI003C74BC14
MALTDDRLECRFDGIKRTGDVVVWTGKCATMGEETSTTVTASLVGERLTLDFGGISRQGSYARCPRR